MIKKIGKEYVIYSESKGDEGKRKKLGSYSSRARARRRLRQIEYHKNNDKAE